jgi:acetyl esterase/lipase
MKSYPDNYKSMGGLLVLAALVFAAGCAAKAPAPLPGTFEDYGARAEIIIKDLPYVKGMEKNPDLMLDVYSNPHQGLWPVVVMIHGGAWFKGSKEMENYSFLCMALAGRGYVVFNINHRLVPSVRIKSQAEDAMAAVIWVKEHAVEYGGDPERIGVAGGSSGGHLAALVAWASDDPYFTPTGEYSGPLDSDVAAAALYYPVLDLDRTLVENGSIFAPAARLVLVGKVGKKYKQALLHLSAKSHLDASSAPAIFLTGDADSLKLYPQSVEFQKRLEDLGVDSSLYTAPGKGHGFTSQYWEPETGESLRLMVEFFDRHLK